MASISVVRNLPEATWREFVETHPHGNIFHTPDMAQVFADAVGHQPECWAAVTDSQVLALLLPVCVTVQGRLPRLLTTRAVVYGSVLCAPSSEGKAALTALLQAYKRGTGSARLFTELRNLTDLDELQPLLAKEGFVYEHHLNYLVDLTRPVEQIWQEVDKKVRTNVRKAQKMGVTLEEVTNQAQVADVHAVLSEVYERIRVPLAPISLFAAAFRFLYPKKMVKFYLARVEGQAIGASARLLYKDTIFAWYAGARTDYGQYKANDLLNWSVIEWGAQNGYRFFDFGGAGRPDQEYGPRVYKAKFNGTLVNYGRNTYIHAPLRLKLSRMGYEWLRKYGRRLTLQPSVQSE